MIWLVKGSVFLSSASCFLRGIDHGAYSIAAGGLLASLMTFGNLGEKFELTAMKAAGISLIRIMRPIIIFMVFLGIGAFFFQNNVLPYAQTKMYTLLFSMRQKSPEIEIPERTFYDQIPGMNLYIEKKRS